MPHFSPGRRRPGLASRYPSLSHARPSLGQTTVFYNLCSGSAYHKPLKQCEYFEAESHPDFAGAGSEYGMGEFEPGGPFLIAGQSK